MARPSTREKLLDCAESLFADQGLARVSLRTINAEAGLSAAALHYHFKTKEALVEALLERRMPPLMARRRELLDALDAQDESPSTRQVLDALIRPLAELLSSQTDAGQRYLRLIYRLQADGDLYLLFAQDRYSASVDRLVPLLTRALPETPAPVLQMQLEWAIHLMLRSLAGIEAFPGRNTAPKPEEFVPLLLDFLTGGFEAHTPDGTP